MNRPPNWKIPAGVSGGLWDYLHDSAIAENYDLALADSPLLQADLTFVQRYFDRPGRLIDLGCGTGRLLVPFARRGFWVLGVDLSEAMLKVARAKAAAAGVTVHLLQANLVELDGVCYQTFDCAACLFSTLGMVAGAANRRRMLENVYRLLRPGGIFVLHVHNRWFNFWGPQGRRWLLRNWLLSWLGKEDAGDKVMPVHQGIAGLTLHLFTRREIVRLLRSAGFRIREVRPLGLGPNAALRCPWWFARLRSQGYLLAVQRPEAR